MSVNVTSFSDHPRVTPKSLLSNDTVEALADDYLFMGGIKFIKEVCLPPSFFCFFIFPIVKIEINNKKCR